MSTTRDISPISQTLLIVALMIGGLLLNVFISFVGIMPFKGMGGFLEVIGQPAENIGLLKSLQILQSICLFIIPAYFFSRIVANNFTSYFNLKSGIHPKTAIIIIISIIAAIPFINLMGEFNSKMILPEAFSGIEEWMKMAEEKAAAVTVFLVSGKSIFALFVNLIMIAALPAIGEELIFRGILLRILKNSTRNIHIAVWVSAFIFSAFHLQFYGFLPRFFIGIILGYLYVASGTLWLPILAHFINNAAATIFYFLFNNGLVSDDLDTLGTGSEWQIGVLSAGILLIIYFYLERHKTQLQLNELK
ncbi:MAG: CPBP family intramembrane metalloprotease [Bacteroidales bacterium]|jgi:membrane protease YdiL (CAAX protease family)|nr:CPBP family intramembrane metalloprotease [Bacteroidales bacterium]